MLDAVVLNTVNQIKAMVASLSVGGSNPVTDTKVAELRTGLTDTRMANLDNIDTSTMAQIDLIKADLDTVLYHIVTSDSGLNTIKYQVTGLENAIISVLDSDASLDTKLVSIKAVVDALRLGLTDARMGYLDDIPTIKTNTDRITSTWAAKLDSLRTDISTARLGFIDLIDSINTRLSDVWSAQLTSLRTAYTDTRATYLDLVNTLNTRLSSVWAAKLDSLRTGLTDQRMANLDAIPEARMAKVDQLRTGLTDARMANLDDIPSIISIAGVKPPVSRAGVAVLDLIAGRFRNGVAFTMPAANTYYTLLNVSGKGVVRFAAVDIVGVANTPASILTIRISIDNNAILEEATPNISGGANNTTITIMGNVGKFTDFANANNNLSVITGLDLVPFDTSFKLEVKVNTIQIAVPTYRYRTIIDYS